MGALGVQGAPDHVGRALRHRARVGPRACVLQRQVHEDRREEHVDVRAGEPVQQLDRGAGSGSGAAPVALRQRVAARTEHLHAMPQSPEQRVEERQRVDQIVRVRQADGEAGGGAGHAGCTAGRDPVADSLFIQE